MLLWFANVRTRTCRIVFYFLVSVFKDLEVVDLLYPLKRDLIIDGLGWCCTIIFLFKASSFLERVNLLGLSVVIGGFLLKSVLCVFVTLDRLR